MKNIHIKNGRVIDPANRVDTQQDVYIADGKVAAFKDKPTGFKAEKEIDAQGCIVCPGLIDLQVHLREPGQEHKGTIESETSAAAVGGITTVCCTPDTQPVIDHPAIAAFVKQRAAEIGKARVVPLGALTQQLLGEQLSEMTALKKVGCVGVSNMRNPIVDTRIMRRCFEYAATTDLTVFIKPEDFWLAKEGCVHEGLIGTRLGLPMIPTTAETIAVARDLLLIEQTGAKVHFSQISAGQSVELIAAAQAKGLSVTADVAVHHLYLTELDINDFNSACHVRPPLRTMRDQELLRLGVKQGVIQAICSDHQPHEVDAKLVPFAQSAPGISGLETLLPLCLRLTENNFMSLANVLALLTINPAKILNLSLGQLSVGAVADMCIFDPNKDWVVDKNHLQSKGHNTPFDGWNMRGKVNYTLLAGEIVYKNI